MSQVEENSPYYLNLYAKSNNCMYYIYHFRDEGKGEEPLNSFYEPFISC